MGKPTGFLEIKRSLSHKAHPEKRIADYSEYTVLLPREQQEQQGARCMDCGIPFCQSGVVLSGMTTGCPLNNYIPEWNEKIFKGEWAAAIERLHSTNNFPEFTGRVCPAPCEAACTVALHGEAVSIKENEWSIVEHAFADGLVVPLQPAVRTGKKVAVVGSGPAGLAAAQQLNRAGHWVTVFERADRIGGLLMYGIPNMKLDKRIVERRVKLLEEEGITFKVNAEVGVDVDAMTLYNGFDAIVLACGATQPRDLMVNGRDLKGVHFAVDFLKATTKSLLDSGMQDECYISAANKNVVVVGGGDTGTDCVATSLRHGCQSLVQLEIMGKLPSQRSAGNPWPQFPKVHKTDYGQVEFAAKHGDDPRTFSVAVKELLGNENGEVTQVKTVEVAWIAKPNGTVVPEEIPNTARLYNADLVLLAMGFEGPEQRLLRLLGVESDVRSNAKALYGSFVTTNSKVFACGDIRRGQSLVVWAIKEGRECAKAVDKFLMGYTML